MFEEYEKKYQETLPEYTIKGAWDRGSANARMGELGFKRINNTITPEEMAEFSELKESSKQEVREPDFVEGWIGAAAEMAPIMLNAIIEGQKEGIKGRL